jgi:hypothetical protein
VGVGTTIQIRRTLVQHFVLLYAQATEQRKKQVLSAFVLATGYHPRYGKWLLTHSGENKPLPCTGRPRQYGPDVQQALEQAWNAANRICSKRLVPFLPELIESLERHGQIQLTSECRAHLLALSAATADRLLHAARTKSGQGLSTTRAGTLLKQQIPIRSSFQWNEAKPGFLEGDLVAHAGKGLEETFLYTFTLTDVATGWTECLPVMGRSRELVLAAFQHAHTLFPFPILGLDTDCGGEFLNEDMVAYCKREQILLTRGRPYLKNDQAYVEQKNGNIVRQVIGHDRYDGEYACQQIAELYRAWRLYVNCFQPSMKLVVSDGVEFPRVARHDPAKTPLQRVLLSGILAAEKEQEWLALARALDPAQLLKQVEQLQQAVFRCAVGVTPFPHCQPATPVLRFHEHLCQTDSFSRSQEQPLVGDPLLPKSPETIDPLAWPRTRRDPFQEEWD